MAPVPSKVLVILEIISHSDNHLRGKTRLQKLVFLTQEDNGAAINYDFEPAPLGPLSEDVNYQIMKLKELDLVEETVESTESGNSVFCYRLTGTGREVLHNGKKQADFKTMEKIIKRVYDKYGTMPYIKLLDFVHKTYPNYHLKGIM